ncbi:hypothetical protein Val02_79070 [Virgisporangium aliadipatigenens]|uniref:Uncharacterized protein n=1 Tax=Virgisporangium aliadipatigenens TaxID=741659 RepID=A0A8J3YWE6_9ACTN|nr:DUF6529 family protein [Virgisporangium aliadipatigenens]GIJ51021.1 hypothetical protein Val02_79070 [Virgisporangium aliadipatigenens]
MTAKAARLAVPAAVGAAVALTLGVYGKLHGPTGVGVSLAGFSSGFAAKSWLATGAVVLALVQLASALVMYGKVPGVRAPSWTGGLHRWSGRIAFLLATPVAVHCLYAAGFQTYDLRTTVHSIMGCFFFGAFTVKMLILPRKGVPGWALPLAGGLVFTALVVLWFSSAFWFFSTTGVAL